MISTKQDKARAFLVATEQSEAPDWRAAAYRVLALLEPKRTAPKQTTRADGCVDIVDYQPKGKERRVGPTMVCTFADGVTSRMTFATQTGKALNVGRGLRHCVNRYRQRVAFPYVPPSYAWGEPLATLRDKREEISVPCIVSAHVEREGEVIARVNAQEASLFTEQKRKGNVTGAAFHNWIADAATCVMQPPVNEQTKHFRRVSAGLNGGVKHATFLFG